jgi:hypothetical protein
MKRARELRRSGIVRYLIYVLLKSGVLPSAPVHHYTALPLACWRSALPEMHGPKFISGSRRMGSHEKNLLCHANQMKEKSPLSMASGIINGEIERYCVNKF